jgi:hypothetical protein
MGTATEQIGSRPWRTEGRDGEVVERYFLVQNENLWEAYANAVPALPRRGDPLPGHNTQGIRGGRTDPRLQVREIFVTPAAEGSPNDALVTVVYRKGQDWRTPGNRRKVVWESETAIGSKTVYHDLDGNIVRAGVSVPVALTTIRARLENVGYNAIIINNAIGKTNDFMFRFWPIGTVQFIGAQATPVLQSDPFLGGATIEYEFQARADGWDVPKPDRDPVGNIKIGEDGAPLMRTHRVTEQMDFHALFPPHFDAGPWTFFDPTFPIIP